MKSKWIASAAFGIPFGAAMYLAYRWMGVNIGFGLTVFAMAFATILCYGITGAYLYHLDKRYAEIEKQIPYSIFYKTNGNFDLGCKIRNGNIYFCKAGIVCVSLDEKPYSLDEILVQDIERMRFDKIHLHIFTKDGRSFRITLPDAEKIVELLKERNWVE